MSNVEYILITLGQPKRAKLQNELLEEVKPVVFTFSKKIKTDIHTLIADSRVKEAFELINYWFDLLGNSIRKDELTSEFILLKAMYKRNLEDFEKGLVERAAFIEEEHKKIRQLIEFSNKMHQAIVGL